MIRLFPARLAEVDAGTCERFLERRLAEGAAQTTVKKELRALGAVLRHARRAGLYTQDPEAVLPELEDTYRPRERTLAPWELVVLCNALPPERAAHVVFIVATGARWGESVRARREDVAGPAVHLRGTKTKRAARSVPTPAPLRQALAWALERAPGDTVLFSAWTSVRRDLDVACRHAGIARVTPDDLRRTFASWLRQWGVTTDLIAVAMGHTTSRMVERVYGRIGSADLGRLLDERTAGLYLAEGSAAAVPDGDDDPDDGGGFGGQSGPEGGSSTGLLMGDAVAVLGHSEPSAETASVTDTLENQHQTSAQGRNRTADTGIFNPPRVARNVAKQANSATTWAANGGQFGGLGAEDDGEPEDPPPRAGERPAVSPAPGLVVARRPPPRWVLRATNNLLAILAGVTP